MKNIKEKAEEMMGYMDSIFIRMTRLVDRGSPEEDLNRNEMKVLHLLSEKGPLTMGQIAVQLGLALSSTTALADKMEERKLIHRYRSEEDRRLVLLGVAPAGSQIFENAKKNRLKFTITLLEQLESEDQDSLIKLHRKIADRFSHVSDEELDNLLVSRNGIPAKKPAARKQKGTNPSEPASK
jgi:DNA-binding MarR family transcriptional regulator